MRSGYHPRRIRFLRLFETGGWRLKVYSILHRNRYQDDGLISAAEEVASELLPTPAVTETRHGVGLVSVHQGSSYDFVTVAHWAYDTELHAKTYLRTSSDSARLEPAATGAISSDVWDLRLLAFEREAWVEIVLKGGRGMDAYLASRLDATL